MIPDFTNLTHPQMKELILQYQKERKPEQFALILLKYDKYILYVVHELIRRRFNLKNEDIQDLYQIGILGFHKGILAFKAYVDPNLLILVIKAYIKAEIKQNYRYKENEVHLEVFPNLLVSDQKEKIFAKLFLEHILSSDQFNKNDKEILRMKFQEDATAQEIADALGQPRINIYKAIPRLLKKITEIAPTF